MLGSTLSSSLLFEMNKGQKERARAEEGEKISGQRGQSGRAIWEGELVSGRMVHRIAMFLNMQKCSRNRIGRLVVTETAYEATIEHVFRKNK